MVAEVTAAVIASSLALLSDAAHMLTDAAALALALVAARLASRPAHGAMTFGLGRAEILSAQANGVTLLVLSLLIIYDAITRLVSPPTVHGGIVVVVAIVGIAVNLAAARILQPEGAERSLNVEGSYQHILTDLYGFIATAIAGAIVILDDRLLARGSDRVADDRRLMLHAAYGLLIASGRVFMEAAPSGLDPTGSATTLAAQPGVVEVHDLHVWEVTSGFPALSAHVVVRSGDDCHERRRELQRAARGTLRGSSRDAPGRSRGRAAAAASDRGLTEARRGRLGCMRVVKPGPDHEVPRGVVGGVGDLRRRRPAPDNIYMAVFRVPPAAQSRPHYHEGCESAVYMLSGRATRQMGRPTRARVAARAARSRLRPAARDARARERVRHRAGRVRRSPQFPIRGRGRGAVGRVAYLSHSRGIARVRARLSPG